MPGYPDVIEQPNKRSRACRAKHFRLLAATGLLALSVSSCAVVSHRVDVLPIDRRDGINIKAPVKVHLSDGSTGMYAEGVTVSAGTLRGKGEFYDIELNPFPTNPVLTPVSLVSVAAMETYEVRVNRGKTTALIPVSILGSAAAASAGVGGSISTGTSALADFPLAQEPQGLMVRITTDRRTLVGELIAARNDGILVLGNVSMGYRSGKKRHRIIVPFDSKLRLIAYSTIIRSDFEKAASRHPISKRRTPKPEVVAQLKLLSRFPQGLSPSLLQLLLEVQGQTSLAAASD